MTSFLPILIILVVLICFLLFLGFIFLLFCLILGYYLLSRKKGKTVAETVKENRRSGHSRLPNSKGWFESPVG